MSDPNDKGFIPPWMEKIAIQGGWKEAEKTISTLAKIKPQAWKAMGETIGILEDFLEGGVIGGLADIGQDLKETVSLKVQEALSPIKNEVEQALAEALAPIMPAIQAIATEVATLFGRGMGAIEAIVTGKWDEWLKQETINFQKILDETLTGNLAEMRLNMQKFLKMTEEGDFFRALAKGWEGFWSDLGWK